MAGDAQFSTHLSPFFRVWVCGVGVGGSPVAFALATFFLPTRPSNAGSERNTAARGSFKAAGGACTQSFQMDQ